VWGGCPVGFLVSKKAHDFVEQKLFGGKGNFWRKWNSRVSRILPEALEFRSQIAQKFVENCVIYYVCLS
jgi:hypothetical protein